MRFILCCILFVSVFSSYGQHSLHGKIVHSQSFEPIGGVYIENISKHILTEADTAGLFAIDVALGDTIVFSSIGYHWKKYEVIETSHQTFVMDEQVYELTQIIKHAPLDFESFTYKIMSMKPYQDSLHLNMAYEKYIPIKEYTPGQIGVASIEGPITGVYNALNKHAKNGLRASELHEQKHYIILSNKKFTKELVLDVTKLPLEFLQEFIAFCAFTDEFLAHATEYQIIQALTYKSVLFKQKYPNITITQ